jgi:hypothetical protein
MKEVLGWLMVGARISVGEQLAAAVERHTSLK